MNSTGAFAPATVAIGVALALYVTWRVLGPRLGPYLQAIINQ